MAQPTTKQSSSAKTSDEQKQKNLSKVSYGADKKVRDQAYNEYVESITPKHNLAANMAKAFVMGGIICCIGQFILNICKSLGLDKEMSGSWCSILLILLSVILTGLNLYPSLANWGGAGALVPITGFANGVAAPAIEFQKEGQVFGIGCKIFTIAGPVILYGILRIWHDEIISFERRQSRNLSGNVDVWKCGIYGNPDYYKHFSEKWHFIYFSIYDNRPVYALDFGSKIYNSARRRKI